MNIRRRYIIISLAVFVALSVIIKTDAISKLFVLLFMGIVPGTDVVLPWWVTVFGFFIALALSIRWLLDQPMYHHETTTKDRARRNTARKRVLKQTTKHKPTKSKARQYKKQAAKA